MVVDHVEATRRLHCSAVYRRWSRSPKAPWGRRLLEAVSVHVFEPWILRHIKRWLKSEVKNSDCQLIDRERGLQQGALVSLIKANLFLTTLLTDG